MSKTNNTKNINKMIANAFAIQKTSTQDADALGFMVRSMILATMPHSKQKGNEYTRKNGNYTLSMLSPSGVGLPCGMYPRLLIAYFTTYAVKNKTKEIDLGNSLASFMKELGVKSTGGVNGTIKPLKDQLKRLAATSVYFDYSTKERDRGANINLIHNHDLWWETKNPEQMSLFNSSITLGGDFYEEIINHAVPIDMRVLKLIKRSPLALDIYMWLNYKLFGLKKSTVISWDDLSGFFGSDYGRIDNFKSAFVKAVQKVSLAVPEFEVFDHEKGLLLKPSKKHITKKA
jgi:hypothetical protein